MNLVKKIYKNKYENVYSEILALQMRKSTKFGQQ